MLLAIDTSTSQAGIALYDGAVLAEMVWQAGRNHGRHLMPTIERTLAMIGRKPTDITALAVARGPGSFTGLRVGLSAAKGLQLALGVPLYGFGSLDVIVHGQTIDGRVRVALAMGRGRFATALYESVRSGMDRVTGCTYQQIEDTVGVDVGGLLERIASAVPLVGDLDSSVVETIRSAGHEDAAFVSPALGMRRPAVLAELAWARFVNGTSPDPDAGEPIYLARG